MEISMVEHDDALPMSNYVLAADAAPTPLHGSLSEEADNYSRVLFMLSDRWRVIECRTGIQWVVQRRTGVSRNGHPRWTGRSFCTTKDGLARCIAGHIGGPLDEARKAFLGGLPARFAR